MVSASEITDTDSDSITDIQPTDTLEKTPITTTVNKETKTEESPEIDDSEGVVTTVSADPVHGYVGEDVQLNATVDRTIPGARLSVGNVVFSRDGVNITDLIPVNDGQASVTVTLEEDWIEVGTLVADYIGTETVKSSQSEPVDFIVSPKVETVLVIDPVSDYVGTTVDLRAIVDSVNPGLKINEGAVEFYFFDKEIAVVDVVNGEATYPLTLTEDMIKYHTIEATYAGRRVYNDSRGSEDFAAIPKVEVVVVVDPVSDYVGTVVQLNATVDSVNPGLRLNEGTITFMVDDVELGVASVENGKASLNITLTDDLPAISTITAYYSGTRVYANASSTPEDFIVVPKVQTVLEVDPVSDYVGTVVQLNVTVDSVNPGLKVNEGAVDFSFFDWEFGVVEVVDGKATYNLTLTEDMVKYHAIEVMYAGRRVYNDSSASESFAAIPKVEVVVVVDPVSGYVGNVVQLNAIVDSVNPGLKLNEGSITFKASGVELGTAPVKEGKASLNITLTDKMTQYSTITAVYSGTRVYANASSNPESFKVLSKESPKPQPKVIPKTTSKTIKQATKAVASTYKVYVNDNLVYSGNDITLGALNEIFDLNFTNGHLVVYLDGEVVFNGTTTDDLSQIIIHIIESLLGEHEIKVVFTDSEGNTNTYKENIVIK